MSYRQSDREGSSIERGHQGEHSQGENHKASTLAELEILPGSHWSTLGGHDRQRSTGSVDNVWFFRLVGGGVGG